MKLKFDANQDYQRDAVAAVIDLFDGQPYVPADFTLDSEIITIANKLQLDECTLIENMRRIQERNALGQDAALKTIKKEIEVPAGKKTVSFPNFSIEMETGTGKTYVYLRTLLELSQKYGFRKFIIVVPSVAIREGVLKTLDITAEHFKNLYADIPYRYFAYNSDELNQVTAFSVNDNTEIMIITLDSFNKETNVLRQPTEKAQGQVPLHVIQATRPVLILDEPQNMKSELSIQALANLDPLVALRYSATHKVSYNKIYRLSPYDAYRKGLVKKVEVDGIRGQNENQAYVKLNKIVISVGNKPSAKLTVHKLQPSGAVKDAVITVHYRDNLQDKTHRPEYAPLIVEEINYAQNFIRFANGLELQQGESSGENKTNLFEVQIRHTIQEHITKQKRLEKQGIKVLSLFFIDKVGNYQGAEPVIRNLFDKVFNELKHQYSRWRHLHPEDVRASYFASHTTKAGQVILEDSSSGETQKDKKVYDLIMKHKERLLSFDEKRCFIFSHSALREGWDNPNVFQICTMNQSVSVIRKRQEIGRGVRLCVNQDGTRVWDKGANVLTIIANESYKDYAQTYQQQMDEEYGVHTLRPPVHDKGARQKPNPRGESPLSPAFESLWEKIKHKTQYSLAVSSDTLIKAVAAEMKNVTITPPAVFSEKAALTVQNNRWTAAVQRQVEHSDTVAARELPNLLSVIENLMEHTSPKMKLSRNTILQIIKACHKTDIRKNPQRFAAELVNVIKHKLSAQLADGIKYTPTGEWYKMEQCKGKIAAKDTCPIPAEQHLYNGVQMNIPGSGGGCKAKDVKMQVTLPAWFTIDTPLGRYHPDRAIILEETNDAGAEKKNVLYLIPRP